MRLYSVAVEIRPRVQAVDGSARVSGAGHSILSSAMRLATLGSMPKANALVARKAARIVLLSIEGSPDAVGVEWEFSRNGERVVLNLRGHIAFNDAEAMFEAGLAGLGVMQAGDVWACDELRRGSLVQILPDWQTDPLPLYVMYPQNRHLSAKVRAFAEWVAEVYERRQRVLAKCDIKEMTSAT